MNSRIGSRSKRKAFESWNEAAREEYLAGRSQLRVAQAPLVGPLLLFAREVDADRPPVTHQVVEQETRWPVRLHRLIEIAIQDLSPNQSTYLITADRRRLEQKEHAAGQVFVVVIVQPDFLHEVLAVDRSSKDALRSGRVAENGAHLADAWLDPGPLLPIDQDHEVVVAFSRDLRPTPRSHEND
jgi:hypothetical protein